MASQQDPPQQANHCAIRATPADQNTVHLLHVFNLSGFLPFSFEISCVNLLPTQSRNPGPNCRAPSLRSWGTLNPTDRYNYHPRGHPATNISIPPYQKSKMSTQTQTETFVLQTQTPSNPPSDEPAILQESSPHETQTKWLYPKILSAGVSFFVAGVNDGSLGSLIPYVIHTYSIGTNMVAVL